MTSNAMDEMGKAAKKALQLAARSMGSGWKVTLADDDGPKNWMGELSGPDGAFIVMDITTRPVVPTLMVDVTPEDKNAVRALSKFKLLEGDPQKIIAALAVFPQSAKRAAESLARSKKSAANRVAHRFVGAYRR